MSQLTKLAGLILIGTASFSFAGCDESNSVDFTLECIEVAPEYHVARWTFNPKLDDLLVYGYGASVEGIQTGLTEAIPAEYVTVSGGTTSLLSEQGSQNFFGNRTIRATLSLAINDGLYDQIVTRSATAVCPQQEQDYCSLENPGSC